MTETIASQFADKIMACQTNEELFCIRQEIQAYFEIHPDFKKEWKSWLTDIKSSKLTELKLNKEDV